VLNDSNMPRLRVLVVDDHDVVRHMVCALISQDPTLDIVCQSTTGEDAVSKAAELGPDLIVLDIGLPGISGIEAARQILQVSPRSKIVFLSQHDSLHMASEASKVGGHGYVTKIDAASELHMAIRSISEGQFFVSQQLRSQGWVGQSQLAARNETSQSSMESSNS
jgi:DNA-binding NarL/FixJ family response regulator